ncbi:MAG: spore coat protein GerQ [bacterium]|nr:spore coat protein GerQ [bacterium]
MNNGYYNPNYESNIMPPTGYPTTGDELPLEQSYVENILRLNKGKVASFYMSFPDSNEWRDRIFTGIVEQAARDHVVISDPKTGKWYILLTIYLNFIVFDEKINYKVI